MPNNVVSRFEDTVKELEASLSGGATSKSFEILFSLLAITVEFHTTGGLAERGAPAYVRDHWYTRAACAITTLITDPRFTVSLLEFKKICLLKGHIAEIFEASGFRGMSHVLSQMLTLGASPGEITPEKVMVYLAFIGIDDLGSKMLEIATKQTPEVYLNLSLAWLSQGVVKTSQGERNRSQMLAKVWAYENCVLEQHNVKALSMAWMMCSYALYPEKHKIKAPLNRIFRNYIGDVRLPRRTIPKAEKSRLSVLVVNERLTNNHAMLRSYGRTLSRLRDQFCVTSLSEEPHTHKDAAAVFDTSVVLPTIGAGVEDLRKVVDQVISLQPDVIYFPSVGMSHWTILLANLRLAPLQIAGLGHPATTHSDCIDYVYCRELDGDTSKIFSEPLLIDLPRPTYTRPTLYSEAEDSNDFSPDRRLTRVAVNANGLKLNEAVLKMCKSLAELATKEVQFEFFPGVRGLEYDCWCSVIEGLVPGSRVHPSKPYDVFINLLKQCDLALASFPFGNTNSTVDTCLSGIPTIVMFGAEPAAQSDKKVLLAAGLPDWLVAHSEREYLDKALALINNDEQRLSIADAISRSNVPQKLFDENEAGSSSYINELFREAWIAKAANKHTRTTIHYSQVSSK